MLLNNNNNNNNKLESKLMKVKSFNQISPRSKNRIFKNGGVIHIHISIRKLKNIRDRNGN